jgi:hypothetical protein
VRRRKDEIRQNYIYFGDTTKTDVIQTIEGELFWIHSGDLLNRKYTKAYASMLEHYLSRSQDDRAVYVGVASNDDGNL